MTDSNTKLIEQYSESCSTYETFKIELEHLVTRLLNESNIRVHSISSRLKSKNSFEQKINKEIDKYSSLDHITDIVGIRIITYFNDEVDAIAKLIEKEFDVDPLNSVDKRALIDPDRFGYLSFHYVVSLDSARSKLIEYKKFSSLKAEIQIRSILQHTWAEIEHDLGYKTKESIPRDIRRSFSRLAGLLEIADIEFSNIRDRLKAYEITMPTKISAHPSEVLIDQVSLDSFIKNSTILKEIDTKICIETNATISKAPAFDYVLRNLTFVGLKTIADIDHELINYKQEIISFAIKWLSRNIYKDRKKIFVLPSGIGLHYLCYVLIGKSKSIEKALDYVVNLQMANKEERKQIAEDIIKTYNSISSLSGQ